jgi:hypothetical protein
MLRSVPGRIAMRAGMATIVTVVIAAFGAAAANATSSAAAFPRYDHVFLLIEENHNYGQIIGNPHAPIINALAHDYGLATGYRGVGDPSEPNYVAMLGGNTFGVGSDDPYFFPANTVKARNLMSELDQAGLTWRGYFQGMPYPGYRGYCFPAKCNGIPDSDTQYVAKHNGIVNFADMQTPAEFAKLTPYGQLARDLASDQVTSFSYIVPDECHDMHGAPPWCLDSGNFGDVDDNWLVATGDAFVGHTVNEITSSPVWSQGNDAIVVTFDEGNFATDRIATIVITNNGPRHATDPTAYNHYSLLASLQHGFGLACLQASCKASPMTPLFEENGPATVPTLPAALVPAPDGTDTVSATGTPHAGPVVSLPTGGGWQVIPSPSIDSLDNNLAAVAAGSASDAWAVGNYYKPRNPNVLQNLGLHWNGRRWTAFPLPDVGPNENTLLGASELANGDTWAVGYYVNSHYRQRTLIERYENGSWRVIPSPDPGQGGDILYGVAAVSGTDAWAVGGQEDAAAVWHPLIEHWDGSSWSALPAPDPNGGGNLLYAVTARSSTQVYAAGQSATSFPSQALIEAWNGHSWTVDPGPSSPAASLDPFGIGADGTGITVVGAHESDTAPFTTLVIDGTPSNLAIAWSQSAGAGENDLFGVASETGGARWAVGWFIDPATGNHETLVDGLVNGHWSLVPSPSPNSAAGDDGLAGVAAVPGGGVWAVGITSNADGNPATLIEYHP